MHFLSYCVTYTNYSLNLFIYTEICYHFICNDYIKGAAKKMAENKKPGNTLSTTEKKLTFCIKSKSCGACHLANLSYDQQLSLKTGTTIKLISKFCHIEPIIGAKNPTGYRNKAQAVFMRDKRNNLVSGIYRSSDGNAVPVDNCRLQTAKTCLLYTSPSPRD